MRCRYHIMIWYDIEIILFDFYGIVWETCWYHGMMWEISNICRGILYCMQGYEKYIIYRRNIELYRMRTYSSHHSSYHFARPWLLLSLRSAIDIVIAIAIAIIITPLGHGSNHSSNHSNNHSNPMVSTIAATIAIPWYQP